MNNKHYLDGKLVISTTKHQQVEITDILTWSEGFTIYQMVMCSVHCTSQSLVTSYVLQAVIIQIVRQYPGQALQEYDLALQKDATAATLVDWFKKNMDLYNFHLQSSPTPTTCQLLQSLAMSTVPSGLDQNQQPQYCHSWNDGICCWTIGGCHFHHIYESVIGNTTILCLQFV